MVVMVYAYESIYCGLHGINTGGVFEVDNVAEADEIGKEMAYDLYLAECGYNVWEVSEEEYEKYKEF